MTDLEKTAFDYVNSHVAKANVSVITGNGAKMFAEAVKDQMSEESDIKFLTIESTNFDVYDMKASRAIVDVLMKLSIENNMPIVVVFDNKSGRMKGHLGAIMERKVTDIITANSYTDGIYHIEETKKRTEL